MALKQRMSILFTRCMLPNGNVVKLKMLLGLSELTMVGATRTGFANYLQ